MPADARDLAVNTRVRLWNGAVITKTAASHHGEQFPWHGHGDQYSDSAVTRELADDATILDHTNEEAS